MCSVSKRKEAIVREELVFKASGDWLSDKVRQAATPQVITPESI